MSAHRMAEAGGGVSGGLKARQPKILKIEIAFFYSAMVAFSFGIAIQQIVMVLFALFQIVLAIIYGANLGTLFTPGRRMATFFLVVTLVCTVVSQYSFPTSNVSRIHWAIAAFWVIAPSLVARINWVTLHRSFLWASLPGLLYSVYWLCRPDEFNWALKAGFEHYPRAFGFVSNPITWAEGLAVFAAWSLARLGSHNLSRRERKWIIAHMALSMAVVLFSRVRAGILGFVVLFAVKALMVPRFRKWALAMVIALPLLFGALTMIFGFNMASVQERFELASNSIELLVENPIFGIGPNKFNKEIEGVRITQHPHNTLLGITTEFGVMGLLAYLAFMFVLGKQLHQLQKRHGDDADPFKWVVQALTLIFVSYHLFGLFDYNYADTELLIIHAFHWSLVALLAARERYVDGGAPVVEEHT